MLTLRLWSEGERGGLKSAVFFQVESPPPLPPNPGSASSCRATSAALQAVADGPHSGQRAPPESPPVEALRIVSTTQLVPSRRACKRPRNLLTLSRHSAEMHLCSALAATLWHHSGSSRTFLSGPDSALLVRLMNRVVPAGQQGSRAVWDSLAGRSRTSPWIGARLQG